MLVKSEIIIFIIIIHGSTRYRSRLYSKSTSIEPYTFAKIKIFTHIIKKITQTNTLQLRYRFLKTVRES